jgi:hypothetical protein
MVAMCRLTIGSSSSPIGFRRLQLWTVGRQVNEADAVGDLQATRAMPSGIVEHEQNDASGAGFRLAREGFTRSASKNGFDTPLERYQKVSPVAGDAKAVT